MARKVPKAATNQRAAMERGLFWVLVLGAVLLAAGTYSLLTTALTTEMNLYAWATRSSTLSLGAYFVLMYFERIKTRADKFEWRRLLVASRWISLIVFLLCVGISTFLGLHEALG
jgi:hypothetical protein